MDTGTCSVNCWTGINCWSMPVKAHIYPARSVWQSTKSLPRVKLSLADHRGRREPLTVTPGRVVGAGRCWSPSVAIVSSMPCELFRSRRMLSTFRSSLYCWRVHVITRSSSVWMIVFRATSMTMFCEFASSVERGLQKVGLAYLIVWFMFFMHVNTRSQRNLRSEVTLSALVKVIWRGQMLIFKSAFSLGRIQWFFFIFGHAYHTRSRGGGVVEGFGRTPPPLEKK